MAKSQKQSLVPVSYTHLDVYKRQLSGAIQRYGALVIDKDVSDQELNLKLDNFYDEAYIMIRMNEGTPGNIEGGELTHITGNLYLLRAKELSLIHI